MFNAIPFVMNNAPVAASAAVRTLWSSLWRTGGYPAVAAPTTAVVGHRRSYASSATAMHGNGNQQKPDWNRAVSEAEKIVGYPTSFLSLRWLLSDEIANVALHLRKLVGSNHPLLKTAK